MDFLTYPGIIKAECEKEKTYQVLVDALDVKGSDIDTMERFFLGEEIAKTLGAKIKLAVVWPDKHITKFVEIVALNRGGNISVVSDLEKAKKWLLNDT